MQYYFESLNRNFPNWPKDAWKAVSLLAALLIISALTIFVMPEILAFLLATFILWGGILLAAFAWRLRKIQKQGQFATSQVLWF